MQEVVSEKAMQLSCTAFAFPASESSLSAYCSAISASCPWLHQACPEGAGWVSSYKMQQTAGLLAGRMYAYTSYHIPFLHLPVQLRGSDEQHVAGWSAKP